MASTEQPKQPEFLDEKLRDNCGSPDLSLENLPHVHQLDNSIMAKRVWRKLDFYILPVATMFNFLAFLDRANISNARVAGLQKDLKMTDHQFSVALTVTYVPFIVAELPSNLLVKIVGPNLLLPTMLVLWGVVTTLQGTVQTYHGLLACRFFLGFFESGLYPGLILYLSFFYPRQRLNWRISLFVSSSSLSGAFSGLLAFGIINLKGVGHKPGWAWIFILEGLFTFVFGLSSYFLLPRSPAHALFLSHDEKDFVIRVLKADGAIGKDEQVDGFSWREVGKAFLLPQVWMIAIQLFLAGTTLNALAYFTPSIVQGLGFTSSRAQLMSVPPFATSLIVSMISSYISDRYHCRGFVTIFSGILCIIGFAMFLASKNHHIQYASLFFAISGTYTSASTHSTWNANNATPHTRRATAIAIGSVMTNFGGILATWLLGSLSAAPRYILATRVLLAFSVVKVVVSALNTWYLFDQNKMKAEIRKTMRREDEEPGLGDKSAWFKYAL